ncbi:phenylalanine--tRNA ligase beta subunit-related protein [Magnetospira thiophila]
MIPITISDDFAQRNITVSLGGLGCRLRVQESHPDLERALDDEIQIAHQQIEQTPISQWPPIEGTRKAYRALGKDPARYRPSAEALLRRVQSGKDIYRVNTVVDVNNLISIRTGYSIGAYDLSKVRGAIQFRRAAAGESYAGIGRGPLNLEGLPIFADDDGPFGSPTSDSERTCIDLTTQNLLMVLIGFGDAPGLREAMAHTIGALEVFCDAGDVEMSLLTG